MLRQTIATIWNKLLTDLMMNHGVSRPGGIRIVGGRVSKNVKIYDAEGRDISRYFSSVTWHCDVQGQMAEAILVAPLTEVEVEAPTVIETTGLGEKFRTYQLVKPKE